MNRFRGNKLSGEGGQRYHPYLERAVRTIHIETAMWITAQLTGQLVEEHRKIYPEQIG